MNSQEGYSFFCALAHATFSPSSASQLGILKGGWTSGEKGNQTLGARGPRILHNLSPLGCEVCLSYGPLQSWVPSLSPIRSRDVKSKRSWASAPQSRGAPLLLRLLPRGRDLGLGGGSWDPPSEALGSGLSLQANPHDRFIINVDLPDEGSAEKEAGKYSVKHGHLCSGLSPGPCPGGAAIAGHPHRVSLATRPCPGWGFSKSPGSEKQRALPECQVAESWSSLGTLSPQLLRRAIRVALWEGQGNLDNLAKALLALPALVKVTSAQSQSALPPLSSCPL